MRSDGCVRISLLAATLAGAAGLLPVTPAAGDAPACVPGAVNETTFFEFTGGEQCYVVPAGVHKVDIVARGAIGGDGFGREGNGGWGSLASALAVTVTPGATLWVYVGGRNGYNGGGSSPANEFPLETGNGGPGGGATDVRTCAATAHCSGGSLRSRLVVGGGGGGAGKWNLQGLHGGDAPGGHGRGAPRFFVGAGEGATETGPGGDPGDATRGAFGRGGDALPWEHYGGSGGGGGGWYGGQGGGGYDADDHYEPGSGGAGSSHVPGGCTETTCYTMAGASATIRARPPATAPPATPPAPHQPEDSTGTFELDWELAVDADSYTLQHRNGSSGAEWTDVAAGLTDPPYRFGEGEISQEPEGTFRYRTIAVNPQGTTAPSDPTDEVKIDRTAPAPPVLKPDRGPEDHGGGFYKDSVVVAAEVPADPDLPDGTAGAGGVEAWDPEDELRPNGSQEYASDGMHEHDAGSTDRIGNRSALSTLTVKVDRSAPDLQVAGCPAAPVLTGTRKSLTVTASDPHADLGLGSGLAEPVPGTVSLATGSPGAKVRTVVARDRVGHVSEVTCSYVVHTVPSAPGTPAGPGLSRGSLALKWAPPAYTDPGAALTYSLQRTPAADLFDWTEIATGLGDRAYAFGGTSAWPAEDEGTWRYRAIASDAYATSPPSLASRPIKVDRTAPAAPTLSIAPGQAPAHTDTATGAEWYRDAVDIAIAWAPDPLLADGSAGSGVRPPATPFRWAYSGKRTVSKRVGDLAGNLSLAGTLAVAVDAGAPSLSLWSCASRFVRRGATVSGSYTATDGGSGLVEPARGTFRLDTSTLGTHTASVTVHDRVGHATTKTCSYTVT